MIRDGHVIRDDAVVRDGVMFRDGVMSRDRGSATAELATGLPALFAMVLFAVGLIWTVSLQARCGDAARIGARVAARGDDDASVVRWASQAAPPDARVTVTHGAEFVQVAVTCPVGVDDRWPLTDVQAVAVTVAEPPPAGAG